MIEKQSLNNPKIRLAEGPVRSINKRMVFVAIATALLAIFFVIYLIPSSPAEESGFEGFNPLAATTLEESQKFQDLQQLPDSYDGVQAVDAEANARIVSEPIDRPVIEESWRPIYSENRQESQNQFERDEAKRSPILFQTERPEMLSNSSTDFQSTQASTQKNTLMFHQKESTLKEDSSPMPGGFKKNASPLVVQQGTFIPAILLSAINTDLPGPILAQVTQNIFNTSTGKHLLIPQGTKIIGEYNSSVSNGQQRAQVVWTRLMFPNGSSLDLGRMPSVDETGTSGHTGSVNHHYDKLALGVLATSLLSSSVGILSGSPNPGMASPQQMIGQSVGREIARMGTKMAEKTLDIPPTLSLKSGARINVFVMSDLELVLYR